MTAHEKVTERLAIPWQFAAFGIDDLHVRAARGAALLQPLANRVFPGQDGACRRRRIVGTAASGLRRAGRYGHDALWRPVRRLVRRLLLAIDACVDDGRRRASRNDGRRRHPHAV